MNPNPVPPTLTPEQIAELERRLAAYATSRSVARETTDDIDGISALVRRERETLEEYLFIHAPALLASARRLGEVESAVYAAADGLTAEEPIAALAYIRESFKKTADGYTEWHAKGVALHRDLFAARQALIIEGMARNDAEQQLTAANARVADFAAALAIAERRADAWKAKYAELSGTSEAKTLGRAIDRYIAAEAKLSVVEKALRQIADGDAGHGGSFDWPEFYASIREHAKAALVEAKGAK